jgi:mRNA interferase RelE/StbE
MYAVLIEKRVFKDLDSFPSGDVARIQEAIMSLQDDPRLQGTRKLRGYPARYRLRQGRYRIIYEIDEKDKIVRVMLVGHRKDVYRGM